VEYLRERVQRGSSAESVAFELGVSGWSLIRWARRANVEKTSELRVVEVVPESRSLVVTLVTPDGYRVEGVSGQAVRTLLEALR
jgi:hypothetical protein